MQGTVPQLDNLSQNLNYGIKGKSLLLHENKFNFYYPRITGIMRSPQVTEIFKPEIKWLFIILATAKAKTSVLRYSKITY
ncbi:hypothetical protein LC612_01060 [Nostoc sp. CHAB 5834]|nr:hypothetical protein [Nostoc sp. CHAB 5834]